MSRGRRRVPGDGTGKKIGAQRLIMLRGSASARSRGRCMRGGTIMTGGHAGEAARHHAPAQSCPSFSSQIGRRFWSRGGGVRDYPGE